MVMVESESTGSTLTVEVMLVVCIISESCSTDSKFFVLCLTFLSHPTYFGKKGIRQFHLKVQWGHQPTINLDKLWTLVSDQTRKNAEQSKDKAAVIDLTKSVSIYII